MTNQQLKAHCEDVIDNPQEHSEMELAMAKALLPCLEAEPVEWQLQCWDDTVPEENRWFDYERYKHRVTPGKNQRVIQYFTAPPAPELKPIELRDGFAPSNDSGSGGMKPCIGGYWLSKVDVINAIRAAGYQVKS